MTKIKCLLIIYKILNIIIPMAGLGSRFTDYGFKQNKYLLPLDANHTKMIEKAILTLNVDKPCTFIFVIRENNNRYIEDFLVNLCQKHDYFYKFIWIDYITEGPASTAYLAKKYVDNDYPLIISNSDQVLDYNFIAFMEKSSKYDGSVLTYTPEYELRLGAKDKNSFVKYDEHANPIELAEKIVLSFDALVGVHFYAKGSLFIQSYEHMFKNDIRAPNGEFYLSLTYNSMLNLGYKLTTYKIDMLSEIFYPVGEPIDYFNYYNIHSSISIQNMHDFQTNNYAQSLNLY